METETKLSALDDLLTGADKIFLNFVHLLAEKGRIAEAEAVHEEFGRLLAREERVLELELTTAVELSDKEAAKVVKQIEEASGRSVVATRTVDPDIIGGIVVQAGLGARRRERPRPPRPAPRRTDQPLKERFEATP